jgi:hypothetical protein
MAITTAVVALESDPEFRSFTKLNFISAADAILAGTFPANVVTDAEKDKVTVYAVDVFQGRANVNTQVLALLAQNAMQTLINATPPGDYYGIMQAQARNNFKNLAGVHATYTVPETPVGG